MGNVIQLDSVLKARADANMEEDQTYMYIMICELVKDLHDAGFSLKDVQITWTSDEDYEVSARGNYR